ncbi:MAG: DMT family transporter [Nanoarchaeota archaeon]|nr:DMT family transporter [Nanoarchaeota archaeon]
MIGIILVVIAAISAAIEHVLQKLVITRGKSLAYTFIWQVLSAILFFILFLFNIDFPKGVLPWIIVGVSSLFWIAGSFSGFKSYEYLDLSIKGPLSKLKIIFVLILSVLIFKESLSAEKLIGTGLVVIGAILITYNRQLKLSSFKNKGVIYAVLSSFLIAMAFLIDKYALNFFEVELYILLVFLLPAIYIAPFAFRKRKDVEQLIKTSFWKIAITMVFGSLAYYLTLYAFKMIEASVAIPIFELNTMFAVVGGIICLKERTDIKKKVISTILIVLGVVLVSGLYVVF